MKLISNTVTIMDGKWSVEEVIREAVEEYADEEPFYVMDICEIVRRYQRWKKLMPRVEPFYAVKCNADKMLVRTLAALGAGFDCASRQEIDLITGIGVNPERIIYSHTTKMASHIRHAAHMGVATTTFDSSDELIKIKIIMPNAKLVLRIRCDAKVAHVSLGSKFGCDPITEAPHLLRMASEQGLDVIGLSFHVGSGAQEFEAYGRGIRHCSKLFKVGTALGFNMRLVDIGGGFPGDIKNVINEVSAVVNKSLEQYFPDESVRVIAEPGQYFACAAYTLAACVFAKRQVSKDNERHTLYYMNDGVYGSFMDCVLNDKRPTLEFVTKGLNTTKLMSNTVTIMDGQWSVERVIREAVEEYADEEPFYVMDIGEIVRRYQRWKELMPRVEPFYAVKCNADKMLVRTLVALGAGFDCASRQEIDFITGIGVSPERIIFSHTTKMASHIRHAEQMGVDKTTFDSSDELIKIKIIMPNAKLLLRIRCDSKVAHISLGSKFGCDPITEAPNLLRMASEQGLDVIGLSFHVGSGAQEFEAYGRGIRHCSNLFKVGTALGFNMRLVDIGGGFPGDIKNVINEVSAVVNKSLEQYFPDESVRVIAEPGQYFACAAYTLAACVFAKRQVWKHNERHTMYYMSDGVFGSFMECGLTEKRPTPEFVTPCSGEQEPSTLWGPTCDGLDCILPSTLLPPLPIGTWLLFRNMGAYTRSVATLFNGFPIAKVQYVVDRRIWSILKDSKMFVDVDCEHRSLNTEKIK